MKKTKIICTMGPASECKAVFSKMADAGMDVVRLNFSHGTHEDYAKKIALIKEVSRGKASPPPHPFGYKRP